MRMAAPAVASKAPSAQANTMVQREAVSLPIEGRKVLLPLVRVPGLRPTAGVPRGKVAETAAAAF